ncbi:hypothetical protein APB26_32040 [Pseudomonas aeruginosa]|uniref:hypothetical protein n=1 Tax=Pseudomonas aeruginosa TaxID=287 RepID=UPI00071B20E7|nr:hypothetical protein [Pseudomonas aeruginosa]KSQ21617.1 hypothetical protein APB26_32040 [Pseudomonas aeruginosa]RPV61286.1 hypothetical protein IPC838_18370 [Pseudomonas aeruginosa]
MNREAFLAQPDLRAFVKWLADTLPTLSVDLRLLPSNFVRGGHKATVQGIEAVTAEYRWKGDWTTVSALLKTLRKDLRDAVATGDETATLKACFAILEWGNVPKSKDFLQDLAERNALVEYITLRAGLLSPAGNQALTDLNKSVFPKFNSGLTKIFALHCPDGSPIYDGRVGGAIALLYHLYRESPAARGAGPTNHRCFAWGPGLDDQDSERVRQIRNPAALGRGYLGTPQLPGYQSPHLWAQRQLILGWIIRAVLAKTDWYGGSEVDIADRCHAFEGALFMAGYDLRCMIPGGWEIPDPKKRAYPRTRKTISKSSSALPL